MIFNAKAIAFCGALLLFLPFQPNAQGVRTTLDNGIHFAAVDSSFSLALRFRVQSRVGFYHFSGPDSDVQEFDLRVRRMRLRFEGFLLNPKFSYHVQLSFSRADQDWDVSNVPNVLRDAMIWYGIKQGFTIGIGQGKLPGNRQRVISSGEQQFADRSIVNNMLTLDRDVGIFVNYVSDKGYLAYRVKTAITAGEGRNALPSDKGLAYTARLELLPLGPFSERSDYFEGDLLREPRPKLSAAGTLHFNERAKRTGGELGLFLYEPRDLFSIHLDFLFKYNGWALSSEYLKRSSDKPKTFDNDLNFRYVYAGQGINTQFSYCTRQMWELALRHSYLEPQRDLYDVELKKMQYGICLGKYLNKHRVKVQTDLTYEHLKNPATTTGAGSGFQWRFQVEMGI